jgi:hypothetical protein
MAASRVRRRAISDTGASEGLVHEWGSCGEGGSRDRVVSRAEFLSKGVTAELPPPLLIEGGDADPRPRAHSSRDVRGGPGAGSRGGVITPSLHNPGEQQKLREECQMATRAFHCRTILIYASFFVYERVVFRKLDLAEHFARNGLPPRLSYRKAVPQHGAENDGNDMGLRADAGLFRNLRSPNGQQGQPAFSTWHG